MIDEFLAFFNSLTKSMDIVYVIEGAKQVSRIVMADKRGDEAVEFIRGRGLYVIKSDFKVSLGFDQSKFSNKGIKIKSSEEGKHFIYLSKEKELAEKAKKLEAENKYSDLGKILGYPECCCRFFEKNYPIESKKENDYVLASLRESEGYVFPFYTNVAVRQLDLNLLSHFPCNFNCRKSIDIAKKNLDILKKWSPELGSISRGMLKGAVIYTADKGIFLLRQSRLEGNNIHYDGVMSPVKNDIYQKLKRADKVVVIDKNHIKIKDMELKGEGIGVLVFN